MSLAAASPSNINAVAGRHPWDVAVVYTSMDKQHCGHGIPWNRFETIPQSCPVCHANIVFICDMTASSPNGNDSTEMNTILFQFQKQIFSLSLQDAKRKWWDRSPCTAQERIAYALGMKEIKILCKGKVLYPNVHESSMDISNKLMELSQARSSKPLLLVMGTRVGQELQETPTSLWNMSTGLVLGMVTMVWNVIYTTLLYLYSYVKPLPPPEQRRDE